MQNFGSKIGKLTGWSDELHSDQRTEVTFVIFVRVVVARESLGGKDFYGPQVFFVRRVFALTRHPNRVPLVGVFYRVYVVLQVLRHVSR